MRISDWSSDVCSSDLLGLPLQAAAVLDQFRSGLRTTVAGEGVRQVAVADLHLGVRPGVVGGHEQAAVAGPAEGTVEVLAVVKLQAHQRRRRRVDEALLPVRTRARSEERRVGKECVRTSRSGWTPDR